MPKVSVRNMVLVALFAALTAIGAWIEIPIKPVPVTFQVFFVLLAGAVLGGTLGALSQIIYVLLGAFGLPVFAGGASGFGWLIGPTGGYLFGFILAAYLIGKLVENWKESSYFVLLVIMLFGVGIIYLLGFIQLAIVAKMTLSKAFLFGVLPFIGIDLIKAIVAAVVAQRLKATGLVAETVR